MTKNSYFLIIVCASLALLSSIHAMDQQKFVIVNNLLRWKLYLCPHDPDEQLAVELKKYIYELHGFPIDEQVLETQGKWASKSWCNWRRISGKGVHEIANCKKRLR